MKKDALLFFIGSNTKRKILNNFQHIGASLCSAVRIKLNDLPYDTTLSSFIGMPPKTKASLRLTVWQKHVSTIPSFAEIGIKNELQSKGLDKQLDNSYLKHSSENLVIFGQSNPDTLIGLPKQRLDTSSLSNLKESYQSNSEIFHKSISSISKGDISSIIPEISSEMTVAKSLEKDLSSRFEDSECKFDSNNAHRNDKACVTDLECDLPENEGTKIKAMLEHCEKMVDDLEQRIRDLTMLQSSCKNVYNNCHACNNCCACNVCHTSCLASHQKYGYYNALNQSCCHDCNYCSPEVGSNAGAEVSRHVPYNDPIL